VGGRRFSLPEFLPNPPPPIQKLVPTEHLTLYYIVFRKYYTEGLLQPSPPSLFKKKKKKLGYSLLSINDIFTLYNIMFIIFYVRRVSRNNKCYSDRSQFVSHASETEVRRHYILWRRDLCPSQIPRSIRLVHLSAIVVTRIPNMVYIFLPRIHDAIIFHDGFKACTTHYLRIREDFPNRLTRPLSPCPRGPSTRRRLPKRPIFYSIS